MIQLSADFSPKKETIEKLSEYQNDVDILPTFSERSEKAKNSFSSKNVRGNVAFDDVKTTLTTMCSGAKRCAYCEDSMADEVEHIAPKDLYPELCFQWTNYLYACGPCNGPKNNKFAIFRQDNGEFKDVATKRGEKAQEPSAGTPVLINPRTENGMDFCILDLAGSFKFVIDPTLDKKNKQRADYTFNIVLRLSDQRESLRIARKNAYSGYKSRFYHYDDQQKKGASIDLLNELKQNILTDHHPTVWKEIQRYRKNGWLKKIDKELDSYFDTSPEAVHW